MLNRPKTKKTVFCYFDTDGNERYYPINWQKWSNFSKLLVGQGLTVLLTQSRAYHTIIL